MATYLEKVKDKKDERSELIKRWQVDSDLLYLKKYAMMDAEDAHKIPDIVNVTLSLPGRFANDVISLLGSAKEQVIVESEDTKFDTTYIEDFRKAGFRAANARLGLQRKFELNHWWDFHSCIRGGCAARCVFQMVDGVLVPDITQWDIRYVSSDVGVKGLDWAGNESTKSKAQVEAEEWFKNPLRVKATSLKDKKNEVLEVLDTTHSEIWLNGELVLEQPHSFGFTPVVIRTVVLGSMLADDDSLAHQGESIFFLFRGVVPEIQRLLSIMQTLNLLSLKPPKGWGSKGGLQKAPKHDEVMRPSAITPHEIGGGITDINFGDAQRSAQLAYSIMEREIREATAAATGLADIESPPASGVRAMIAGERGDQLLSPRLGVKAAMNQGLSDMFTAQVIQIGGSVELGTPGHKRKFETGKLEGEYEAYYKYTIKSAAVDAGRASLAAAYGDDLSWRTKAEQIYQLEDVDGEERRRNVEMAGRISPAIKLSRIIDSLVEDDKSFEADLLTEELGINLKQMLAGEGSQPKPEPEQEPKQVLSLFGGAGGRVAKPKEEEE